MNDAAYKQWWPLHRRTAVGDPLSVEEQTRYEAGLRQLEAEEAPYPSGIEALKQARQRMLAAKVEYQRLQKLYDALQVEVAAAEARLDEPTRQLLASGKR